MPPHAPILSPHPIPTTGFQVRKALGACGGPPTPVIEMVTFLKQPGRTIIPVNRRPNTHLSDEQKAIIDRVREETRLCVMHHFYEFRKRRYTIPHNKIHQYHRETGKTTPNPLKQQKGTRCRSDS